MAIKAGSIGLGILLCLVAAMLALAAIGLAG